MPFPTPGIATSRASVFDRPAAAFSMSRVELPVISHVPVSEMIRSYKKVDRGMAPSGETGTYHATRARILGIALVTRRKRRWQPADASSMTAVFYPFLVDVVQSCSKDSLATTENV